MIEVWKDIEGCGGNYMISNLGRVKSIGRIVKASSNKFRRVRESIIKTHIMGVGYEFISLNISNSNKNKMASVHRLVAIAFIPNPNNYKVVNHLNGIKNDNRVENLEWCTTKRNIHHAIESGFSTPLSPERSATAKLNWEMVNEIRSSQLSRKELVAKYNVHPETIRKIINYKCWIPGERKYFMKRELVDVRQPVLQYDLSGNFIGEYPSIKEASVRTGLSLKSVYNGFKKRSRTFIWKYKNK